MRIDAASGFVHGVRRSVPKAVRTECPDLRGSPQIYPRDNRHGFVVRTHSPNFLPRRFNFSPQGPEIFIPLGHCDLTCVKGLTLSNSWGVGLLCTALHSRKRMCARHTKSGHYLTQLTSRWVGGRSSHIPRASGRRPYGSRRALCLVVRLSVLVTTQDT